MISNALDFLFGFNHGCRSGVARGCQSNSDCGEYCHLLKIQDNFKLIVSKPFQ